MRLRYRFIVAFLIAGLLPFTAIGVYGYWVAYQSIAEQARNHLVSVRDIKLGELAFFFDHLHAHMRGIRENPLYGEAVGVFGGALGKGPDSEEYRRALAHYGGTVESERSLYDFNDIWLVDGAGDVVFSALRGPAVGTNLLRGEFRDTGLAAAFRNTRDAITFSDFTWYPPADQPLAFFGVPLTAPGGQRTGVAVVGIGPQVVNRVMTQRAGLGERGETILIGPDLLMRSDAILDPQRRTVTASFRNPDQGRIETGFVRRTLAGESGLDLGPDYRGVRVLAAYAPIDLFGVRWAFVAKIDAADLFAPAQRLRWLLAVAALVVGVLVLAGGWLLMRSLTRPLDKAVSEIAETGRDMSVTAEEHERTAAQQSAATNETATTMNQLAAAARSSVGKTESAAAVSEEGAARAEEGGGLVREMLASMDEIQQRTEDIGRQMLQLGEQTTQIREITQAVTDLSSQINLLSLNAAVEAVRAGEHGKGFGVVAQEIRNLADQSKRSAARITGLLREIENVTNRTIMATEEGTKTAGRGTEVVGRVGEAFQALAEAVAAVADNTREVALSARQEADAIRMANEAVGSINASIRDVSAGARQTRMGVETLNRVAERLRELV